MERKQPREVKQLCGIIGEQLYKGDLRVVKRQRIQRKHPKDNTMQPARGFLEPEKGEIHILKRDDLEEQVITLLHEMFHFHNPHVPEDEVEIQGIELFNALNERQKNFFLTMIHMEPIENRG